MSNSTRSPPKRCWCGDSFRARGRQCPEHRRTFGQRPKGSRTRQRMERLNETAARRREEV